MPEDSKRPPAIKQVAGLRCSIAANHYIYRDDDASVGEVDIYAESWVEARKKLWRQYGGDWFDSYMGMFDSGRLFRNRDGDLYQLDEEPCIAGCLAPEQLSILRKCAGVSASDHRVLMKYGRPLKSFRNDITYPSNTHEMDQLKSMGLVREHLEFNIPGFQCYSLTLLGAMVALGQYRFEMQGIERMSSLFPAAQVRLPGVRMTDLRLRAELDLVAANEVLSGLPDEVLVWSQEWRLYWLPNGKGYTRDIGDAGVYSIHDAYFRTAHCGEEKGIFFTPALQEPAGARGLQ